MKYSILNSLLYVTVLFISCQNGPEIVQKPIVFDQVRSNLSLKYMAQHYGMIKHEPIIDPKMVVIHWTAIPDLEESFEAFNTSVLPHKRGDIESAGALNVSAHFLVDRDGTIYQLLPETTFARHVIGLNYCAIGIENVADDKDYPLTEAQFIADKQLVQYLTDKYNIEYLIGHDQYKRFIGHDLWKEQDPTYLTEKNDVGEAFINRLFDELNNKNLKRAPLSKG